MSYKYASLPEYTYQPVSRQYQTFNYETSSFSLYPITYSSTDLTEGQNQDNNEPAADPEKGPDPEEAPVEESSAPADDAPAAEPTGKYMLLQTMRSLVEISYGVASQHLTCVSRSRCCATS